MGIDANVAAMLEAHLSKEGLAAATYMAFSLRADEMGMVGCAAFFEQESKSEREHLAGMLRLLNDFDSAPEVPLVPACNAWDKPIAALFAEALILEEGVTASLSAVWAKAQQIEDGIVQAFLQPYLEEQRSAEAEYRTIIRRQAISVDPLTFDAWIATLVKEG